MIKIFLPLLLIALSAPLAATEFNFDIPGNISLQGEIAALETAVPPAPPASDPAVSTAAGKEWTVMVFMNGKNDLEGYALRDMNEMEMAGSTDKVNIVVELGRMAGYSSADGNWAGSRRYLVQKDDAPDKITSPVLQKLGRVDMGDCRNLVRFINWAKAAYPAKKYMLIVWNHGTGWDKAASPGSDKGISYDHETGNYINTPQLGWALRAAGKVNVYASDACLMQMVEVAYELKDAAQYIVGSEEAEYGGGYPYDKILAALIAKPSMGAKSAGRLIVNAYAAHYKALGKIYTHSLIRTAALPGFLALVNDFADAMLLTWDKSLVRNVVRNTRSYYQWDNRDMAHFAALMAVHGDDAAIRAKAAAVRSYITDSLVVHNRASAGGYEQSHGIAAYLPLNYYKGGYADLAWAKASKWDEFFFWYMGLGY